MKNLTTVICAMCAAISIFSAVLGMSLRKVKLQPEATTIESISTTETATTETTTVKLTETAKTEPTSEISTTAVKIHTETKKIAETSAETTEKKKESKVVSKLAEIESKIQSKTRKVETTAAPKITPAEFRRAGVIYYNGYKFTYYSEKVLPGKGLRIPGRHSDGNFVRDEDNYICVASSDLPKGAVVNTPFGEGKVYDTGCPSGVIDIYVSW